MTARKQPHQPAHQEGLIPRKPPRYRQGQEVVFRGFVDGRRWTVVDAEVALPPIPGARRRSKKPHWLYTITSTRDDGSRASTGCYGYRLLPAPDRATVG